MRTTREQQKARSREALMRAALSLIGEDRRFSDLSLRQVTREAGVTPPAFYRHFPDMEALGLALVAQSSERLRGLIRRYRDELESGRSPIRTSAEIFINEMRANPNAFRLLVQEVVGGSRVLRRAVRDEIDRYVADMATEISERIAADIRDRYDTHLVAEAITLVGFAVAADVLDRSAEHWDAARERIIEHARVVAAGAAALAQDILEPKTQTE